LAPATKKHLTFKKNGFIIAAIKSASHLFPFHAVYAVLIPSLACQLTGGFANLSFNQIDS
jgi:hypothetical protein